MSDQNNEFERDMLARELYLLLVQSNLAFQLKRDKQIFSPFEELSAEAYQGADAFIEAGRASKEAAE